MFVKRSRPLHQRQDSPPSPCLRLQAGWGPRHALPGRELLCGLRAL